MQFSSFGGRLSKAECEVALAICRGLSNAEIAGERGTSPRTIANQVAAIFRKLGVHSRVELAMHLGVPCPTGAERLSSPVNLSARTLRILAYRITGHSLKCIAYELGMSTATIWRETSRGMRALGVRSAAELAGIVWSVDGDLRREDVSAMQSAAAADVTGSARSS